MVPVPEDQSTTDECPHGYVRGDHHWFGCFFVDPFAETAEVQVPEDLYRETAIARAKDFMGAVADDPDNIKFYIGAMLKNQEFKAIVDYAYRKGYRDGSLSDEEVHEQSHPGLPGR